MNWQKTILPNIAKLFYINKINRLLEFDTVLMRD